MSTSNDHSFTRANPVTSRAALQSRVHTFMWAVRRQSAMNGAARGWITGAAVTGLVLLPLRQLLRLPVSVWWPLAGLPVLLALLGAVLACHRRRISEATAGALLDAHCRCGGLLVAEDLPGWDAWQPAITLPGQVTIRRSTTRRWPALLLMTVFAFAAGLWPHRPLEATAVRQLDIGPELRLLQEQVELLEALTPDVVPVEEWLAQLEQLGESALSDAPAGAWDILDTMAARIREHARESIEDALWQVQQVDNLAALIQALHEAAVRSPSPDGLPGLFEELAAALEGLPPGLDPGLASELAEALREAGGNGLDPAALERLAALLADRQSVLTTNLVQLQNVNLIDAATLALCTNRTDAARQAAEAALQAMLADDAGPPCSSGMCTAGGLCVLIGCAVGGSGGIGKGPGPAPMIIGAPVDAAGAGYRDAALAQPDRIRMEDLRLQGIDAVAPETEAVAPVGAGRLNQAVAAGGAARRQSLLPRHRRAVAGFFDQSREAD